MDLPEMTFTYQLDCGEFTVKPHSAAANAFLAREFETFGDRDLTLRDADSLRLRALRDGFRIAVRGLKSA